MDTADLLFNACEETGRIDVQRMEDDAGAKATEIEIERWKQGKGQRLWLATYTGRLERKQMVVSWPE